MKPPIVPVNPPSCLRGQLNGAVDPHLLAPVEDGATAYSRTLVANVAAGMRRLHQLAATAGITLSTTGRGRTLEAQYDAFCGVAARYQPCSYAEYLAARVLKRGKQWPAVDRAKIGARLGPKRPIPDATWWHKINFGTPLRPAYRASSAVPGTSNHGWNIADDLAEIVAGRRVSLRPATREWLYRWAPYCGFAWETTAELWHVHWIMGDLLPPALQGDDDMRRIRATGDFAVFTLGGTTCRHVVDGNISAALDPLTGPITVLDRAAFRQFDARGPLPDGWLGGDFASWTP